MDVGTHDVKLQLGDSRLAAQVLKAEQLGVIHERKLSQRTAHSAHVLDRVRNIICADFDIKRAIVGVLSKVVGRHAGSIVTVTVVKSSVTSDVTAVSEWVHNSVSETTGIVSQMVYRRMRSDMRIEYSASTAGTRLVAKMGRPERVDGDRWKAKAQFQRRRIIFRGVDAVSLRD